MTTTPNFGIGHLAAAQLQKEVTVNAAFDALDAVAGGTLSLDLAVLGTTVTLTMAQLLAVQYVPTGAIAEPATIIHPAVRHLFVLHNGTGQDATVKVAGQTGVTVPAGVRMLCFCNGTDVSAFARDDEGSAKPYDIGLFFPAKPEADEVIALIAMVRAVTLPAGAPLSQARARIPPTGAAEFRLQKNGIDVGTIAFDAAAETGTFTVAAPVAFAEGDQLSVVAPAVQDATLEGLSFTIAAVR